MFFDRLEPCDVIAHSARRSVRQRPNVGTAQRHPHREKDHRGLAAAETQRRRPPKMKTIARSVIGLMALLGAGVAGDARAQVCTNSPLPEVSAAVIPANVSA